MTYQASRIPSADPEARLSGRVRSGVDDGVWTNVAIKLILLPLGRLTSVVNMEQSNNGSGGRTPECNRPWAEQPTPILGPLRYRVDVYYPGLRADHLLSCPCKATRVSNPANHFAFVKYKNTKPWPACHGASYAVLCIRLTRSECLVLSSLQVRPLRYRFTTQGRSREANGLHASP
ncbi:hypothetical protein BDW60DRAFT_220362 [Aspergillus nidulans var. acristatus]